MEYISIPFKRIPFFYHHSATTSLLIYLERSLEMKKKQNKNQKKKKSKSCMSFNPTPQELTSAQPKFMSQCLTDVQ